jgi:hypothetical protein
MFVNTGMPHSGATESHHAGEHGKDGANRLTGISLSAGMFGDFDAAQDFHEAVDAGRARHTKNLCGRQKPLRNIATKANWAAPFTEADDHNANALRDMQCSYNT